jgi:hypothetical protein
MAVMWKFKEALNRQNLELPTNNKFFQNKLLLILSYYHHHHTMLFLTCWLNIKNAN